MGMAILFVIISVIAFILGYFLNDRNQEYEWKSSVVTIDHWYDDVSSREYFAKMKINGKVLRESSVPYQKSDFFLENGDTVEILYRVLPSNKITKKERFIFKVVNTPLKELKKTMLPWSEIFTMVAAIGICMAIAIVIANVLGFR